MTKRNRILLVGLLALVAGLSVTLVVLGQTARTGVASGVGKQSDLWAKVAANLGITTDALTAALDTAKVQMIDEALAAGTITAEQAQEMKARLEARKAMEAVLSQAVADGKITAEQLEALRGWVGLNLGRGRGPLPRGMGGGRGCAGR